MRAYTLTILTQLANTGHPVVEKEIVEWVNNKVSLIHYISFRQRGAIMNFMNCIFSTDI